MSCDCSSCKDYSLGLTPFNRKWLEKCSLEKCQLYQPKPVAVETVVHVLVGTMTSSSLTDSHFSLPELHCTGGRK